MRTNTHDETLLKKLAAALSANPRATTQALANAAGISRATFNRFCGSRENLMEMITQQAELSLQEIIHLAKQDITDYKAALAQLLDAHFQNEEYLVFSFGSQCNLENPFWENYLSALDLFFQNGQKASIFKLNFTSQMLTELFLSVMCGMIDAKHRGRIAAAGIEAHIASFFLNGAEEN
jgi:TetR/AcrR family transcriptional repressor of mexCD-oprJ operon